MKKDMNNFEQFKKNAEKCYIQANEDWLFVNNDEISDLLADIDFESDHYLEDVSILDSRYITVSTESMADFLYVDKTELVEFLKETVPDFPN